MEQQESRRNKNVETNKDFKESGGVSDFHAACISGDIGKVKEVLSSWQVEIEIFSDKPQETSQVAPPWSLELDGGVVPLHLAAQHGHLTIVRALVEAGAGVDIATQVQATSLHFACQNSHVDVVKYLLEKGADVFLPTRSSLSPLHIAAQYASAQVVLAILDSGGSPAMQDKRGRIPLHFACEKGHVEVVKVLLESMPSQVNRQDSVGVTPLHIAAKGGRADVVALLLDNDATLEIETKDRSTALHLACWKGHSEAVRLLLVQGAKVNRSRKQRRTALHLACKYGHTEIVSLLLEAGANPNLRDETGKVAVQCTKKVDEHNRKAILKYFHKHASLAERKSRVSEKLKARKEIERFLSNEEYESTCTSLALEKRKTDSTSKPRSRSLNSPCPYPRSNLTAEKRSNSFVSDLTYISDKHSPGKKVPETLSKKATRTSLIGQEEVSGGKVNPSAGLFDACARGDLAQAQEYLEDDSCDPNWTDPSQGATALHTAAFRGQVEIVGLLLSRAIAIDVNTRDVQGDTPLHMAVFTGQIEIVKTLLEHGADKSIPNNHGEIPGCQFRITVSSEEQHVLNSILTGSSQDPDTEANDGLLDPSAIVERLSAYVETPPSPGSNPAKRLTARVGRMHAYVNGLLKQKMKLETDIICIQKELEQLKIRHKKTTSSLEVHIDTLQKKYDALKKDSTTRIKKMEGRLDTSNEKKTQDHKVYQKKIKDYAAQIVSEQKKRLLLTAKLSEQKKKLEVEGQQKLLAAKQHVARLKMDLQVEKKLGVDFKMEANRLSKQVKEERKVNQELQGSIRMIEQENNKIRSLITSSGSIKVGAEDVPKLHGLTCQLGNLSCDHIKTLLYNCGYGNFVENFTKQRIDGSVLSDITQQDLEKLGMDQDMAIHMMEKILAIKILGVPLQSFVERHDDGCSIM